MKIQQESWLHERYELSLTELCELSGLSESELRVLVDAGAIVPADPDARNWTFSADRLVVARSASRLRRDFDLDPQGLALALALLERVRDLEEQLRALRARIPGGSRGG
jgi:chaperone modulatory protein CbpM